MTERRRVLRRVLTVLVVAAAVAFLYHTASTNWRGLRHFHWRVDVPLLVLSIAAHVGVLAWGVAVWSWALRHFDVEAIPYPALLRVWSLSNTTRYIPGTVWQFLTAAQLSRAVGLSGAVALTSLLVHVAVSLLAALTISAATLPLGALGLAGSAATAAVVGAFVLAIVLVHPAVINLGLRLLTRIARRPTVVWCGNWLHGVILLGLANVSWLLYGIAYYLFASSLAVVSPAALLRFAGINALSFAAGYAAVLAPGGLGVRESAMTLLLAPLLPAGVAAVLAIAARLWSVVSEVVLALCALLIFGRSRGADAQQVSL